MAYPIALRHFIGTARHSICLSVQAFAVGRRVLGLQFHVEATGASVRALLKGAASEIGHGVFEQQPGAMLAGLEQCTSLRPLLDTVLHRLTGF